MMKKILIAVFAIGLLVSCNNQKKDEATAVTTAEFATVAENLVDQTVTIEGTVLHVCKHGGKKLFLNEDRVKVIASEVLASFDAELEGSIVVIKGIIREEAVPVLAEDEQKVHANAKAKVEPAEESEATHEEGKEEHGEEVGEVVVKEAEAEAADCDMEETKPLYVIEVVEITEKIQ